MGLLIGLEGDDEIVDFAPNKSRFKGANRSLSVQGVFCGWREKWWI